MQTEWTKQFGEMSQKWTETQRNMWEGWYKMIGSGFSSPNDNNAWDVKQTTEQFKASQEALLRLYEFTNQAWQSMAEQIQQGADWQKALDNFMAQTREQLNIPTEWMHTSQDASKLWQLYIKQWEQFGQPWSELIQQTPHSINDRGAAMVEWSQLYWDTYDRTVGRLIDSPGVGLPREMNRTLTDGFVAWQKSQQASSEYRILMADTTLKAFSEFMQKIAQKAQAGEPIHTFREFVDLWTETADTIFVELFETEEYTAAQWNLLNSNTAYRLKQRKINDLMAQFSDTPTRTEVDEAHRNIYEQGKAIKSLQKAVGQGATSTNGDTAAIATLQQTVTQLQQELAELKKQVAEKPKTTRRRTTKTTQKRATPAKGDNT